MNMINSIKEGEKIPFNKISGLAGNIDYTLFFFPVVDNHIIYGVQEVNKTELQLVKLDNPPCRYKQYEYSGYANHLFKFINVDHPHNTIKYRSAELSNILPYINTGRVTMMQTYTWNIHANVITQYWGTLTPTSLRVKIK